MQNLGYEYTHRMQENQSNPRETARAMVHNLEEVTKRRWGSGRESDGCIAPFERHDEDRSLDIPLYENWYVFRRYG